MSVEKPLHEVTLRSEPYEVREYPALVAAEISATGERGTAANAAFRRIAAFISGANSTQCRIGMTVPVLQSSGGGPWTIRFLMPRIWSMKSLPAPDDPGIRLRALPPSRMAVVSFPGLARPAEVERRTAALRVFMTSRGLSAVGAPLLARYDPPWTPWFLRRNEVMIPLRPASPGP